MAPQDRMVIKLAPQHKWFENMRNKALIIEYLMDQEFGGDVSDKLSKNREIMARKIVRAQEIIEKMKVKKMAQKNEQRKKPDKRT